MAQVMRRRLYNSRPIRVNRWQALGMTLAAAGMIAVLLIIVWHFGRWT